MANLSYYIDNHDTLTYEEYSRGLEYCLDIVRRNQDESSIRGELSKLRGTFNESQLSFLESIQVFKVVEPINMTQDETTLLEKYNFYTKDTHHFLLSNRFIVEVRDASSRLITVIGWYPDTRKYITIATRYFSKQIDWFNIDEALDLSLNYFNGAVFVVEGIFDTLSLRALGLPVIGAMGVSVDTVKSKTLSLFDKIVAIPDGDDAGFKALKYWVLPRNTTKVRLNLKVDIQINHSDDNSKSQSEKKSIKVKDIDDLISYLDSDSLRPVLTELLKSKNIIEVIE